MPSAATPDVTAPRALRWPWEFLFDQTSRSTRILDAVLVGLIPFRSLPGLPSAIPPGDLFGIVLVVLALFRRPTHRLGTVSWLIPVSMALLGYLVVVSMVNDVSWTRRAVRLTILVVLSFQVGTGRIDIRSGLRGLAFFLVANGVLFVAGVAPNNYGGNLTGWLDDKNRAGMVIGVDGLLAACLAFRRRWILPAIALTALGVWLTGSRTTLAGFGLALVWMLVRPSLHGLVTKVAVVVPGIWILNYIEVNFARAGEFASRVGSDALRERIAEAVATKLALTPWYGGGLGTASVEMDGATWFFHSSYDGLRQEGGWVLLVLVTAVTVWLGLRPMKREVTGFDQLAVEAATIVQLVCAWKLGEVFLSTSSFILLGYALQLYLRDHPGTRVLDDQERVLQAYASRRRDRS